MNGHTQLRVVPGVSSKTEGFPASLQGRRDKTKLIQQCAATDTTHEP